LRQAAQPVAHSLPTDTCPTDPELALIHDAWSRLPAEIRTAMTTLARPYAKKKRSD
jgi:hypothetical protein